MHSSIILYKTQYVKQNCSRAIEAYFPNNPENIYTINLNGLDNEGLVYEITNQLALLNINIEEFLRKNTDKEFEEKQENEKQLLQEEKKNGKN